MAYWDTVASGNSLEEFKNTTPSVKNLNAGEKGRVVISGLPAGMAHIIFDIWGAEQTVGAYLAPAGAHVDDCHEENGIGYVEFTVTGTPLLPLIAAVAALCIGLGFLGILIAIAIQILRLDPEKIAWWIILLIVFSIVAASVVTVLIARKGRVSAGKVTVGK